MDYTTPGTILPNGAIVVAARFNMPGDEAVIVALTQHISSHPYATWRMDPTTGNCYSGDYCMTFEGAIRSYAARSGFLVETLGGGAVPPEDTAQNVTPRHTDGTLCHGLDHENLPGGGTRRLA